MSVERRRGGWRLRLGDASLDVDSTCHLGSSPLGAPLDPAVGRPRPRSGIGSRHIELSSVPAVDDPAFERLASRCRRAANVRVIAEPLRPEVLDSMLHLAAQGALVDFHHCDLGDTGSALRAVTAAEHLADPELRSVRLRRSVLRTHGTDAWAARVADHLDPTRRHGREHSDERPSSLPPISVLLATRRPHMVIEAARQLSRQRGVRTQVVVGAHGDGFAATLENELAQVADGAVVKRFEAGVPLGTVLDSLTDAADSSLVTKWDDDDWYGGDHLADLALAYQYSGAQIVGKRAEFVYLEASDQTIRRDPAGAEAIDWSLAGGTLLTSKAWLREIGGWRPVPRSVDRALLDDTRANGGVAYRTHGYQYVLRRSAGTDHTWAADDEYFLRGSIERRPGLALNWADVDQVS